MDIVGTWGTYPCYDIKMIRNTNRKAFDSLPRGSRLYRCTGKTPEGITLEYGSTRFTASPLLYRPQRPPAFTFDEEVVVKTKDHARARINGIFWHFRDNAPCYTLTFSGKMSSRRYWDRELEKLPSQPNGEHR